MKVVHWGKAKQFYRRHPAAEIPLKDWKKTAQKSEWRNFHDIRAFFPSADWVHGNVIFNIKGNHYRLIAIARFHNGRLYIRQVLTHEEYNHWKA